MTTRDWEDMPKDPESGEIHLDSNGRPVSSRHVGLTFYYKGCDSLLEAQCLHALQMLVRRMEGNVRYTQAGHKHEAQQEANMAREMYITLLESARNRSQRDQAPVEPIG